MQVNLFLNKTVPNFRASFAKDVQTEEALKLLTSKDEINLLASCYALQDIPLEDEISLKAGFDEGLYKNLYYVKNENSGKEVVLNSDVSKSPSGQLLDIILNGEIVEKPPYVNSIFKEKDIYIKKAYSTLEQAIEPENIIIKNLQHKIEQLKNQLLRLQREAQNLAFKKEEKLIDTVMKELKSGAVKIK